MPDFNQSTKTVKIYHNPRCSKSRQALELIRTRGVEPEIIEYLKTPPSKDDIKKLAKTLDLAPIDMMRKGEDVFKDLSLGSADDDRLFAAMAEHPVLIERPIVMTGKGAKICRPPELVEELLNEL